MEIWSSLEWQKVRTELIKMSEATGRHQKEMKTIVENLDVIIT